MTLPVRRVAGALTIVEALWLLHSYYDALGVFVGCPIGGGGCIAAPTPVPTGEGIALLLIVALVAVGALGAWGMSVAYFTGSALSAIALLLTGYTVVLTRPYGYLSFATNDAILGVAFSLVALLVNFQAMRAKRGIPEQVNPMNLPVFG